MKSLDLFLSLSCTPHITVTMDLSTISQIYFSLFYVSLMDKVDTIVYHFNARYDLQSNDLRRSNKKTYM